MRRGQTQTPIKKQKKKVEPKKPQTRKPRPLSPAAQEKHNRVMALKALPYTDYLKTEHWKGQSTKAMKRAKHRCQVCYTRDEKLNAHHRTYERLGHELPSDLTTLCEPCHSLFHQNRKLAK